MVSCCICPPFRTNPPPRAQAEARLRNASSDHGSRHRRACKLRWMLDVLAMGFLPPLRAGPGLAWLRKQARWRRCNAARLLNIGGATPRRRKIPVLEHESICQNPKWGLRGELLTARQRGTICLAPGERKQTNGEKGNQAPTNAWLQSASIDGCDLPRVVVLRRTEGG